MRRGDVTLWLTPDAIATWAAAGVGRRSGQLQYSDLAIETALTLSLLFHVPLRQTEGVLTSIFGRLGVDLTAPDHTTLSRRGQHLARPRRRARPGTSLHLIVDSTGLSIVGAGEWAAATHGGRGRRGWRKHTTPTCVWCPGRCRGRVGRSLPGAVMAGLRMLAGGATRATFAECLRDIRPIEI